MATGPRCFKCRYDMPSVPVNPVSFVLSITVLVMLGVEGRWKVLLRECTSTRRVRPHAQIR